MKEIARTIYVQRLIDRRENGLVKIITELRRAGKSYLLFKLYYDHLTASGVADDHIIRIPSTMSRTRMYWIPSSFVRISKSG